MNFVCHYLGLSASVWEALAYLHEEQSKIIILPLLEISFKFENNYFFILRKCDATSVLAVSDVVHHSPTESSRERSVNCYHAHLASVHNVCSYYLDRYLPNPHQVYMVTETGLDGYRENRKPFTGEKH